MPHRTFIPSRLPHEEMRKPQQWELIVKWNRFVKWLFVPFCLSLTQTFFALLCASTMSGHLVDMRQHHRRPFLDRRKLLGEKNIAFEICFRFFHFKPMSKAKERNKCEWQPKEWNRPLANRYTSCVLSSRTRLIMLFGGGLAVWFCCWKAETCNKAVCFVVPLPFSTKASKIAVKNSLCSTNQLCEVSCTAS